jgi:hypothetical protein
MQQRQRHNTYAKLTSTEPEIGDIVRITGSEWFGHQLMASLGMVIDKQDRTGEPVECACLVLVNGITIWVYISDLTVESRASHNSGGIM